MYNILFMEGCCPPTTNPFLRISLILVKLNLINILNNMLNNNNYIINMLSFKSQHLYIHYDQTMYLSTLKKKNYIL